MKTEGTLYIVSPKTKPADGSSGERLVRAFRESTALRHVAKDTLVVRKAEVADALRLGRAGVTEEDARGEEPAATATPGAAS